MKPVKLIDVIKNFYFLTDIIIYQTDSYLHNNESEEIYRGAVLDVPWYITEMYIDNDGDGGIGAEINNHRYQDGDVKKEPFICVYVKEEI